MVKKELNSYKYLFVVGLVNKLKISLVSTSDKL